MDIELERIQNFISKYTNEEQALIKAAKEYETGIQIAHHNAETFLKERRKWITENLSIFITDLINQYKEIIIWQINIYNELDRFLRVKLTTNNKLIIIDYYANKGWTIARENSEL